MRGHDLRTTECRFRVLRYASGEASGVDVDEPREDENELLKGDEPCCGDAAGDANRCAPSESLYACDRDDGVGDGWYVLEGLGGVACRLFIR